MSSLSGPARGVITGCSEYGGPILVVCRVAGAMDTMRVLEKWTLCGRLKMKNQCVNEKPENALKAFLSL